MGSAETPHISELSRTSLAKKTEPVRWETASERKDSIWLTRTCWLVRCAALMFPFLMSGGKGEQAGQRNAVIILQACLLSHHIRTLQHRGSERLVFWQKPLPLILFQLDKGLTYLAPYFVDMIICEGLPYPVMEMLEGCRPYITTTTTNRPPATQNIFRKSKRQSSSSVSSQSKTLVRLSSLLLSCLVSIQLSCNNISIDWDRFHELLNDKSILCMKC